MNGLFCPSCFKCQYFFCILLNSLSLDLKEANTKPQIYSKKAIFSNKSQPLTKLPWLTQRCHSGPPTLGSAPWISP